MGSNHESERVTLDRLVAACPDIKLVEQREKPDAIIALDGEQLGLEITLYYSDETTWQLVSWWQQLHDEYVRPAWEAEYQLDDVNGYIEWCPNEQLQQRRRALKATTARQAFANSVVNIAKLLRYRWDGESRLKAFIEPAMSGETAREWEARGRCIVVRNDSASALHRLVQEVHLKPRMPCLPYRLRTSLDTGFVGVNRAKLQSILAAKGAKLPKYREQLGDARIVLLIATGCYPLSAALARPDIARQTLRDVHDQLPVDERFDAVWLLVPDNGGELHEAVPLVEASGSRRDHEEDISQTNNAVTD